MQATAQTNTGDGAGQHLAAPVQYLRFALGSGHYAVAIAAVREILQVDAMTQVPLMPPFVRGVMNLRGAVVPVIDLSERLLLEGVKIGKRSCVVIVDIDDVDDGPPNTLGVMVDAVYEVFEPSALETTPAFGTPINPDFIDGMASLDNQVLSVVNLARILAPAELQLLVETHVGH